MSDKKIIKCLAAIALFLSLALGAAGCNNSPANNGSDNNDPTDIDNPTTYSAILKDVMQDNYYADLISKFGDKTRYSNAYDPIPYAFLSAQGFNISDIKSDAVKCVSTTYIKGDDRNNLYVTTRVEGQGSVPYYSCYLLKYSLTDKEYDELYMLHDGNYIQAPFFIQELAEQKTATVEHSTKITVQAYEELLEKFKNLNGFSIDSFGSRNLDLDFLDFSIDKQIFNVQLRNSNINNINMIASVELRDFKLEPSSILYDITINNDNCFSGPSINWTANRTPQQIKDNYTNITYFDSYEKDYKYDINNKNKS